MNLGRLCRLSVVYALAIASMLQWMLAVGGESPRKRLGQGADAALSSGDSAVRLSALPAERKPMGKSHRIALDDMPMSVPARAVTAGPRLPSTRDGAPWRVAGLNHPSRASLCRFLI